MQSPSLAPECASAAFRLWMSKLTAQVRAVPLGANLGGILPPRRGNIERDSLPVASEQQISTGGSGPGGRAQHSAMARKYFHLTMRRGKKTARPELRQKLWTATALVQRSMH